MTQLSEKTTAAVLRQCAALEARLAVEHDLRRFLLRRISNGIANGQVVFKVKRGLYFRTDAAYRFALEKALGPNFIAVVHEDELWLAVLEQGRKQK